MKKGNSKPARKARIERSNSEIEVVSTKKRKKKNFYISPLRETKSK